MKERKNEAEEWKKISIKTVSNVVTEKYNSVGKGKRNTGIIKLRKRKRNKRELKDDKKLYIGEWIKGRREREK